MSNADFYVLTPGDKERFGGRGVFLMFFKSQHTSNPFNPSNLATFKARPESFF